MYEIELRTLWLSINDAAIRIADLRDRFLILKGGENRFDQLHHTYTQLRNVECALYEWLDARKNVKSPDEQDRLVLMIASASVENGATVAQLAQAELEMLTSA